jgi:hypothetical protein
VASTETLTSLRCGAFSPSSRAAASRLARISRAAFEHGLGVALGLGGVLLVVQPAALHPQLLGCLVSLLGHRWAASDFEQFSDSKAGTLTGTVVEHGADLSPGVRLRPQRQRLLGSAAGAVMRHLRRHALILQCSGEGVQRPPAPRSLLHCGNLIYQIDAL